MKRRLLSVVVLGLLSPLTAQGGGLFDAVAAELEDHFYDRDYRRAVLPDLARRYRDRAHDARSLAEERYVVHAFLSEIPASHLALYSQATADALQAELRNRRHATFGFQLVEIDGRYFVHAVLEGGPADLAGLTRGDLVCAIDGVPTADSERLDWRSDDAHLPDRPLHQVLCDDGDTVELACEIAPGRSANLSVTAARYRAIDAARASIRVIVRDGVRLGYVHLWFMHMNGIGDVLEQARAEFAECDGLLLDIRGRGGSIAAVATTTRFLDRSWGRPTAVLIDRDTRSAKELLADAIRTERLGVLVGEHTAGAVIPASFAAVGHDSVLMFPRMTLRSRLEGTGVAPDVEVTAAGPFSSGDDPILDAGIAVLLARARS